MAAWCAQQWDVLRQELAVAMVAAGLVANVAWLALGGWAACIALRHLLVFITGYPR